MWGTLRQRLGCAAVGLAAVAVFVAAHPGGRWLQPLPLALLAGYAVATGMLHRHRPAVAGPLTACEGILLAGLALYLGTSAITDPHLAWPKWPGTMVLRWLAGAAGLAAALQLRPGWRPRVAPVMAGVFILWAGAALWARTRGAPLYNDDHPSFIFRLSVLAESFPRWIPYNPYWNGGGATTYEAASGATGPALLLWPLLRLFPALNVYTPGIALLFLGVVPLVAGLSVRAAGGGGTAAWTAAILAVCPGFMLFRWLLKFGAIGSCLAMTFLLPVAALLARLTAGEPFGWKRALALVAASVGFLLWPGSWPIALALLPALALTLPRWTRGTLGWLAGCGALVLLLVAPLMISLLARTDLAAFSTGGSLEPGPASWRDGLARLGAGFREMNPLGLWLGVAGGAAFARPGQRAFLGALVAGLVLMAGWGELLGGGPSMPRAILALAFVAILPASLAVERLCHRPALAAPLFALLAVSGYSTVRFYDNRTPANYRTVPDSLLEFAEWLQHHTPDQARILFGGMTVHAYGGGHVAMLPRIAGREMLAADYYHFSPRLVEYFCPPREFRRTDADVHRYLQLYNVSHVVAYDVPSVVRFYRKYPDLYEEVATFDGPLPKTAFRVRAARESFFHQNSGRVEADVNRLRVRLDDPAQDAVIAYHYADGLAASSPAEVYPVEHNGRRLIGIRPNGCATVEIRYRRWW